MEEKEDSIFYENATKIAVALSNAVPNGSENKCVFLALCIMLAALFRSNRNKNIEKYHYLSVIKETVSGFIEENDK